MPILPSATRVILRYVAGSTTSTSDLRGLLSASHEGLPLELHQRITLGTSLFEIADILPTTRAVFNEKNSSLVVLKSMPEAPSSSGDNAQSCIPFGGFTIFYESSLASGSALVVSTALRALIDTVTREDEALFCGTRVRIVSKELEGDPYCARVSCLTTFLSLSNASRLSTFRVNGAELRTALVFGSEENKAADIGAIVKSLFTPLPRFLEATQIIAVKMAPVAPYAFRRFLVSEEVLWSGLRKKLSAMQESAADGAVWLSEGQVLTISKSETLTLGYNSGHLQEEEALERISMDIRKSSKPSSSSEEFFKDTPTPEQFTFVEVISVLVKSSSGVDVDCQLGGGYFCKDTRLEVGDVSDGDLLLQLPYCADAARRVLGGLSSTHKVAEAIQQCVAYQIHHDEECSTEMIEQCDSYQIPAPRLQTIVVHGDEANFVFETVRSAVTGLVRLPFHVHDCRTVSEKTSSTGTFDFGIGEVVEEGIRSDISRPHVLIIRHAQLLEGNSSARHAVAHRLERSVGYLIVIFCHERNEGSSGKAGPNTNTEGGGASGVEGSVRLSSSLSTTLVTTLSCPVPNEGDRVHIVTSLFPDETVTENSGTGSWVRSITLSPSLIASWTVGFSAMDIVALVGTIVWRAKSRHRVTLAAQRGVRIVLSDEDFLEGLADYQHSHGLVVSSTKLQPVRWSDVGGLHEAKKEILETIQLPTKFPHLFKAGGMQRKMGILLFGPPGCGKTLLAKAVATEMNMNFLSVKGPELINQYVGESEKNVRDIFQRARDNAPCVLFFDELDALAPARGAKGDAGGAMDRIVSQLLVEMDGVDKGGGDVFIVAATNRPDMLDAALLRPGRFDQRCYLGPPDGVEEKALALKALTRKFALSDDVDLMAIAHTLQETGRYTGADLFALCSDAMLFAVEERVSLLKAAALKAQVEGEDATEGEEDEMRVCSSHFERALSQLKPSVTAEEFEKYERLRSNMDK